MAVGRHDPGRRRVLKGLLGAGAAATLARCSSVPRARPRPERLVLVRFGGGVRHGDLWGDPNRCLAPYLRSLARSGTVFPEIWNDHLTRHDTATRYLLTGRYGTRLESNDRGEENLRELDTAPTLFERYRKVHGAPETRVLAAGVPEHSDDPEHGSAYRAMTFASERGGAEGRTFSGDAGLGRCAHLTDANQRLLRITGGLNPAEIPRTSERRLEYLLAAAREDLEAVPPQSSALKRIWAHSLARRLHRDEPYLAAEQADRWLTDLTLMAMSHHRPNLVSVAFSTPDLAHLGAWRSYSAAVRQIDLQLGRLVRFVTTEPYYKGRTLLLVTTDCGRGEQDFGEHMDPFEEPAHRRLFLLALGVGQNEDLVVTDRRQLVDVAVTAATALSVELPDADGQPLLEVAS